MTLVLAALRAVGFELVGVGSGSMSPTLHPGDHVLVVPMVGEPDLGDMVLLRAPSGDLMIKRVVATAGSRVALRDGRLLVDGAVQSEPYADSDDIDSVYFGPVTVPERHVFVLGDRRAGSEDSRTFGPVPVDVVEGQVVKVLW